MNTKQLLPLYLFYYKKLKYYCYLFLNNSYYFLPIILLYFHGNSVTELKEEIMIWYSP